MKVTFCKGMLVPIWLGSMWLGPIKSRPCFFSHKRQTLQSSEMKKTLCQRTLFFPDSVALKSIINGEYRNCSFRLHSHLSSEFNHTGKLSGIKYLAADILQQLPLVDPLISDGAYLFFFLISCLPFLPFPVKVLILVLFLSTYTLLHLTLLARPAYWIKH